ncbi:hypothetical protein [Photobacterium rosenbergii]|uniref:hypothetical protein n=1 Tax=Photobacterium rosenbergii TaxID=294936 RepID=UPI001C99526C|nr:hypothetical protein [Photobacterium rosenbergii]MBY5944998.1 hypothetical protein [Photobacterium rosenbergii]
MNTFPINVEIKKDAPETVELFHKSGVVKSTSLTTGEAFCPVVFKTHYDTLCTNIEIAFGENDTQVLKVVGELDEVKIGEIITVAYYKDSRGDLAPYGYRLHSSKETYFVELDGSEEFFFATQGIDMVTYMKNSKVKGMINRTTMLSLWVTMLLCLIVDFDYVLGVAFIGVFASAFWFFWARKTYKANVNHVVFQLERFKRDLVKQFNDKIDALDSEFASLDVK